MKTALLLFFLLGFLGLVVGWAVWAWQQTAGVEMSGHGYAAMTLGNYLHARGRMRANGTDVLQ